MAFLHTYRKDLAKMLVNAHLLAKHLYPRGNQGRRI